MKNKLIYIILLIILCTGFYLLGTNISNKSPLKLSDTARLMEDGAKVKMFTGEMKGGLGIEFVFTDNKNNILNTLSVENTNISGPSYKIIKGNKHDWLVVTTIGESGTGYIKYIDSWYLVISEYGEIQKVLSYDSKINDTRYPIEKDGTTTYKEINSDFVIGDSDNILDIKLITKICKEKDVCNISTQTNHYIWNSEKSIFILNN